MDDGGLERLIRRDIAGMPAYVAVPSLADVSARFGVEESDVTKLDAGENEYADLEGIHRALEAYDFYNRYPDPDYKELRRALACYAGTEMENVMVGSGSDELIDLVLRLVLNVGDKVINCPPTFGVYEACVSLNHGRVVPVARKDDFTIDVAAIEREIDPSVKAIIICNPNNPTGTLTRNDGIEKVLETEKLIVVDEAYIEFGGTSVVPLLSRYPNLIVLRTLSKWAGLAGLRLGYGIMSPFIVGQLQKIKPPYNVNVAAVAAGLAVLDNDRHRPSSTQKIISERERTAGEVGKISGVTVYPSATNSLFIQVRSGGLPDLRAAFEDAKIAVRYYDSPLTGQAVRVTIGRPAQNDQILRVLQQFDSSAGARP